MTKQITVKEKIAVVEALIESVRWARADPAGGEAHHTWVVLKAVAADLRGQLKTAPVPALESLSFQIDSARLAKARLGYVDIGHHQAVSECLMAFWPVVRHALERHLDERRT